MVSPEDERAGGGSARRKERSRRHATQTTTRRISHFMGMGWYTLVALPDTSDCAGTIDGATRPGGAGRSTAWNAACAEMKKPT